MSSPFLQFTVFPLNSNLNLQKSQALSHVWCHLQRYSGLVPSQQTTSLTQMLNIISTRLPGCQCTLLVVTDWQCSSGILQQKKMYHLRAEQKHSSVLSGPANRKLITNTSSAEGLQQKALNELPSTPGLYQDMTTSSSPAQFQK